MKVKSEYHHNEDSGVPDMPDMKKLENSEGLQCFYSEEADRYCVKSEDKNKFYASFVDGDGKVTLMFSMVGIEHFDDIAPAKSDKKLTPKELEQIHKEALKRLADKYNIF